MTKAEKFVLKRRLRDCYSTDKSRVYEIAEREIDRIPTTEERPELTLSEVETYANEHNYVLWTEEMSEKALALIKADRERPKGE